MYNGGVFYCNREYLYATACLVIIIFCSYLLTDQAFIFKVLLLPGWSVPDHLRVHHPWPCPRRCQSQVQGTSEVGHGACPGYWALISWLIGMEEWKSDFNKLVKWSSVVQADFVTLNIESCPDVSLGLQEKSVLIFIGPESDHWLCLSLTHSLTHWLLFSGLDGCE